MCPAFCKILKNTKKLWNLILVFKRFAIGIYKSKRMLLKLSVLSVPTPKNKWQLCNVIEVLANTVVIIILQYISYEINKLYTLNLHSVMSITTK